MKEATVGYLLRGGDDDQEILFGKRLSLFRNGIWIGPGGKLWKKESIPHCLKREVMEETGLLVDKKTAVHFATIDFYYPFRESYRVEWKVHFLRVPDWVGKPRLINGFSKIAWFKKRELPYELMNADVIHWLPAAMQEWRGMDRLMLTDVFYGDTEGTIVERVACRFVSRQKKSSEALV